MALPPPEPEIRVPTGCPGVPRRAVRSVWTSIPFCPRATTQNMGRLASALKRQWPETPSWRIAAARRRRFRFWTRTTAYLEAVAAGEMRRDLAGNPTEPPTEEQRAAEKLGLERRAAARAVHRL